MKRGTDLCPNSKLKWRGNRLVPKSQQGQLQRKNNGKLNGRERTKRKGNAHDKGKKLRSKYPNILKFGSK